MPPKDKNQNMKQKTLLGFFQKPSQNSSSPAASASEKQAARSKKASTPPPKETPTQSSSSLPGSQSTAVSSSKKAATPAASNADVTMVDDEDDEDDGVRIVVQPTRNKRKLLIEDDSSDDEVPASTSGPSFAEKLVGFRQSEGKNGRGGKRARTSSVSAHSEDLETMHSEPESTRTASSRRTSGDGASILSDEDEPVLSKSKHVTKGRASIKSKSSRASSDSDDSDDGFIVSDDDDLIPLKSKPKAAAKPKPKASSGSKARPPMPSNGSSNNFLTAAEQRVQTQKNDKKSNDECYSFLQQRKDKDGNLPDSPNFDPRTLYIPPSAWKTFTPFEHQFWTIKQNQYDTVLFFQKGKFYELYENDAEIGHTEFDLKLTDRVKMKMVGVPEMSFDFWAAKFLAKGYKVGRVDQAETSLGAEMRAAKKGGKTEIVRRELGKILTNGTLVDANMLTDDQAGHLISIREDGSSEHSFGLCILDASTSEFNMSAFVDDVCGTKLETVIRQLRPKEILYTKGNLSVATTRLLKSLLSSLCIWSPLSKTEGLAYDATLEALEELYPQVTNEMSDGEGSSAVPEAIRSMKGNRVAMEALGGMIWYLRALNLDKDMLSMKNFCIYDPMRKGKGLILDGQTLAHIEVLRNNEGSEEGSLLKLLSNCITPFGKRLFRIWLCMPLREVKAINDRLDAVDDLMDNPTVEDAFTQLARGLPDLERIVSRIHAGSCKPKEFLKVLASFKKLSEGLNEIATAASKFKSRSIAGLLRGAPDLEPFIKNIEDSFEAPDNENDDLMPLDGKDSEFDEIQNEISETERDLGKELKKLKKEISPDLEYWHSPMGTKEIYLVQAPVGVKNIPKKWVKNGGTKAKTRWVVPELMQQVRKLKEARETRKTVIKDFKLRLYADFDADRSTWLQAVRVMAELDCLFSLAKSSATMGQPACRPEFVESDQAFLDFKELRHPAIALKSDFIPNNVTLGGDAERIFLLTGPNMGGKSTVMRMTAVGVILAQLGMYVPAKSAKLSPVDAILTRMGAYDNMFSNSSTFKVEMDECCKILREATPKSLVILDELGRGTSTYDGMAIAGAVLHQLASHTLALSCFATHYSSLTDDYTYHPNIRNMHMATVVDEAERKLVFTYKLTNGVATSSFGTHVANLAGVPLDVVNRAEAVSQDFAKQFQAKLAQKRSVATTLPLMAQSDFAYLFRVAAGLKADSSEDKDDLKRKGVLKGLRAAAKSYLRV